MRRYIVPIACAAAAGFALTVHAKVFLKPGQQPPPNTFVMMVPPSGNGQCDSLGFQRMKWTRYCAYQRVGGGPPHDCMWLDYEHPKRTAYSYTNPADQPPSYSWREGEARPALGSGAPSTLLDCRQLPQLAKPKPPLTGGVQESQLSSKVEIDYQHLPRMDGKIAIQVGSNTAVLDIYSIENSDFDDHPFTPNQTGSATRVTQVTGGLIRESVRATRAGNVITYTATYRITSLVFANGQRDTTPRTLAVTARTYAR